MTETWKKGNSVRPLLSLPSMIYCCVTLDCFAVIRRRGTRLESSGKQLSEECVTMGHRHTRDTHTHTHTHAHRLLSKPCDAFFVSSAWQPLRDLEIGFVPLIGRFRQGEMEQGYRRLSQTVLRIPGSTRPWGNTGGDE